MNILLTNKEDEVFIQYKKIQDVTAQLSGTLGIFITFTMLVLYPYVRNKLTTDLINQLFMIEDISSNREMEYPDEGN